MNKRISAILIALVISCLNLGDQKPLGAQPLEIQMALSIPGPTVIVQKPLVMSLDERLDAQQLMWECRMRDMVKNHGATHRNTDRSSSEQNPLPAFSAFLTDAYKFLD